jgi:Fur family ferric uptake transcriptional regulator
MSHQDLDLGTLLHAKGYRLTAQRQLILDAVCEAGGHATPDEITERVQTHSPAINRTTVYRTLEFLCDIGLVTSTTTHGGHLAYELASEEQHHHLVCRQCGDEKTIPHQLVAPMLTAVSKAYDFQVVELTHLSLFGVCAACRAKAG